MERIDQREKSLVFCATQVHAAAIRDLISQKKTSKDPLYCCRVTANDGALGDQYLREFQDNKKRTWRDSLNTCLSYSTDRNSHPTSLVPGVRCLCDAPGSLQHLDVEKP
jgi:hypothetical protein